MSKGEVRLLPSELKAGDIIELETGFWTEIVTMQRKLSRGAHVVIIETSYGERSTLAGGRIYRCWRLGEEMREAKLEELQPSYREPPVTARDEPAEAKLGEPIDLQAPDMTTHFDTRPPAKALTDFIESQTEANQLIVAEIPLTDLTMAAAEARRMPVTEAERRRYAIDVIADCLGHRPHVLDVTVDGEHHVPGFLTLRAEDFISIAAALEDHS